MVRMPRLWRAAPKSTGSKRIRRAGMTESLYSTLLQAWIVSTLPMLILPVTLLSTLLLSKPLKGTGPSYFGGQDPGNALYSKIPATQLTFMSSVSSTLATALLPASMTLFSFIAASDLVKNSDAEDAHAIPSPYQLSLLIKVLSGSIGALWSVFRYFTGFGSRKLPIIPNLWRSVAVLVLLLLVALATAVTDAWLNFTVNTGQYTGTGLSLPDESILRNFLPSRGLPPSCLINMSNTDEAYAKSCYANLLLENNSANFTEYGKLLSNKSDSNQILSTAEGSVIIPAAPPAYVDFDGYSLGSSTNCTVVTNLCQIFPVLSDAGKYPYPFNDTFFNCTSTSEDPNLNLGIEGTFSERIFSHDTIENPVIPGNAITFSSPNGDRNKSPHILSGPANSTSCFGVFFGVESSIVTNTTMLNALLNLSTVDLVSPFPNETHDKNSTFTNFHGQPLYATPILPVFGLVPLYNLSLRTFAFGGILSCNSRRSNVTYSFQNGSVSDAHWDVLNGTAGALLTEAGEGGKGYAQLQQGMRAAVAGASRVEDIASGFANAYDQTSLSLVAGMLSRFPPTNTSRSLSIQVSQIPRAPFLALMILDIAYAVISTGLFIAALVCVRRGDRVADAQARLSVKAVVAESFENPAWGDDAKTVDMLFAERRKQKTRKVAIVRRAGGGRKFKLVIPATGESEGKLLTSTSLKGSKSDIIQHY